MPMLVRTTPGINDFADHGKSFAAKVRVRTAGKNQAVKYFGIPMLNFPISV